MCTDRAGITINPKELFQQKTPAYGRGFLFCAEGLFCYNQVIILLAALGQQEFSVE